MDSVSLFLIAVAAVLLLGSLGEVVFHRTGLPSSLWLVLCGLVLGPVLGLVPRGQTAQLVPYLVPSALVVAIADLGGRLRWDTVLRGLSRCGPLAGLAFVGSFVVVLLISGLAHAAGLLPESWGWSHGLLLGATLGASCALITSPAMVRARLAPSTIQSLELESSLAAVASVLLLASLIALFDPAAQGFLPTIVNLLVSLSLGIGLGLLGGVMWFGFLYVLQAPSFAYVATVSAMLVLYVFATRIGASGVVAVLVFTVVLSNAPAVASRFRLPLGVETGKDPLGYRRLIMFLVRSAVFLFVGLMLGPPWDLLVLGVLLALLLVPARLPAVLLAFKLGGWSPEVRSLATLSLPRGILAVALAFLPLQAGVPGAEAIPLVVFAVVVVTILTHGTGLAFIRRGLGRGDVLAVDVDGEIGASPVSLIKPDKASSRALMPSSEDAIPPTSRSPQAESSDVVRRPLPPPNPPPRRGGASGA